MSVAGSASSHGTHSRSRSRSRSPPYSDGRYFPPRYPPRYESYSYRLGRSTMSAALDDYRELRERDRDRDRDRERERPPLPLRDDRYMPRARDSRYAPYYRDDLPSSHHYSPTPPPTMSFREYPKPPVRIDAGSSERLKDPKLGPAPGFGSKDIKDEPRMLASGGDSYTPSSTRYSDWRDRDRERERERDRRYREDDRWGDIERRNRERDSYVSRDMMRYDLPAYGAPPPPSMPYPPPLFGGDSYRPDRDRDRDRDRERERDLPPSPRGTHTPYYDRDRLDDRYFDRRGPAPPDSDRYRNRLSRSWGNSGGPGGPGPSNSFAAVKNRDRERDREREPMKSPRMSNAPAPFPSWNPQKGREEEKSDFRRESTTDDKSFSGFTKDEKPCLPEAESTYPVDTTRQQSTSNDVQEYGNSLPDSGEQQKTETIEEKAETDRSPVAATDNDEHSAMKDELKMPSATDGNEKTNDGDTSRGGTGEPSLDVRHEVVENTPADMEMLDAETRNEEENSEIQPVLQEHSKPSTSEPMSTLPSASSSTPAPALESSPASSAPVPASVSASESEPGQESSQIEENDKPQELIPNKETTQQEIVERISQIENEISMYEEILEKRKERNESKQDQELHTSDSESIHKDTLMDMDDLGDEQQITKEEEDEAEKQALKVISESGAAQSMTDLDHLYLKPSQDIRKKSQFLINQTAGNDSVDEMLLKKIMEDNRAIAKENSRMIGGWQGKPDNLDDWSDEEAWSKPLHNHLSDYLSFKINVENFGKLKVVMASHISARKKALKRKELLLKKEYKELYKRWKDKNLALDNIREHDRRGSEKYTYRSSSRRRVDDETEDYVDGVIFHGDHDALKFGNDGSGNTAYNGPGSNGPWTSDAARSEAELLEIIQSLETADMRNPELRAAKTTATIPDMILDPKERMRTYDDRSGLVEDPLTYYHTGPETEDVWTQREMTTFVESYVQYPKQFEKIAAAIGTKTAPQCVLFYYRKKTRIDFKSLVSKGRRGRAGKRRDRLIAAVRRATDNSTPTTRKAKSKGSALMTDIGEAQVSRIAKEKESERKSRELKELQQANAHWDSAAERKRTKAKASTASGRADSPGPTAPTASASGSADETAPDRRRQPRRKGRSPRASEGVSTVVPSEIDESLQDSMTEETEGERVVATTAKWTEKDKESAVEAFKAHGRNFTQVASLVGTKTEDQCRNFYHNFKRKFGPNVFDEESDETMSDVQTYGTRTVLKSEEDAAAALVGMCRMRDPDKTMSVSPTEDHPAKLSTPSDKPQSQTPRTSVSSGSSTGQRRRWTKATSTKAEDEGPSGWSDADTGPRSGRKPGRALQSSVSSETKRPAYSSYWSVSERSEFKRCLALYGRDWEKVASVLKTKTATQVRNFYINNEDKMELGAIVQEYNRLHQKEASSVSGTAANTSSTTSSESYRPVYEDNTPPNPHFQSHPNYSYPTAAETDSKTLPASPYPLTMGPRIGYFTPSPPAQPSRVPHALPPSTMMHNYGTPPYTPSQRSTHIHGSSHAPPAHFSPVSTPPQRMQTAESPAHPVQPSGSLPLHLNTSPSQSAPAPVTKVADLLNNEDSGETAEKRDWKSWFES